MALNSFYPCLFFSENGLQCEEWVARDSVHPENKFCALHAGIPSLANKKAEMIERRNDHIKFCSEMTLDELENHIREQEVVLEQQREKVLAARGVRADKLDKLSEEEREVRRKIKIEKTEKPKKEKAPTLKNDPIRYLMNQLKCSEAEARKYLEA